MIEKVCEASREARVLTEKLLRLTKLWEFVGADLVIEEKKRILGISDLHYKVLGC
jgi:hypothetical protein